VGRQERPLNPNAGPIEAFADDLRQLRRAAGNPGYRTMARRAGYSASALSSAAAGRALPSLAVTLAYAGVCGGDLKEWEQRWEDTFAKVTADEPPSGQCLVVPRELPLDVYGFTGRADEIAELDALLEASESEFPAVVISAVAGAGGVGKTALAVHWAHRVSDRFPDGQLYVDLRGYDPDQPLQPADALAGFLRALGLAGADIPYDEGERATRFRTLVAGRRMLVLLDNALSADHVRLLLPGTPTCFVVVTSRDSLAGLVARHGARRVDLDLLPPAEAVALLRTLVGHRIDAEPAAAAALARACARLPLALRLTAEMAAARPAATLDKLVAELADEHRRLDLLDAAADNRSAVRAVFSWSYRHLPVDAARVLRLLGLHPRGDFDAYAVAALAGTDLDEARRLIQPLARGHLVEEHAPGRYRMHDLLRMYAAELAGADPVPQARLFDYYLSTAAAAMDTLYPAERYRRPVVAPSGTPAPPVGEPALARAWLDAERANLVAVTVASAAHAGPLAATIGRHLDIAAHYNEALTVHGHALLAARRSGDRHGEGDALHHLGAVYWLWGRNTEAVEHYQQALAIRREIGYRVGEGHTLNNLGLVHRRWGRYSEAVEHYRQALAIQREIGDRAGEALALGNLGVVCHQSARYAEALDYHQQGLLICRELGNRAAEGRKLGNVAMVRQRLRHHREALADYQHAIEIFREFGDLAGEAGAMCGIGQVHLGLGRHDDALDQLGQALEIVCEIGDRSGEADVRDGLGALHRAAGRPGPALEEYRQTLVIAREIGYRSREVSALNGLGDSLAALGRLDEARNRYETARRLAREIGDRDQLARALTGLGDVSNLAGNRRLARTCWQDASTRYAELDVPEAAEVHARLTALDAGVPA
jgi:tetratricopeptide (TPR) repeat protein